jgi:uncharacterized protein (DUF1697 family)
MSRYVALLRGINVGGKNLIGMPALAACFEAQGFTDVATYIQSGNVLFTAGGRAADLTARIAAALSKEFGYRASLVLRTREQLRRVVEEAPRGFGSKPALRRYDVIFLMEPLTAEEALAQAPVNPDVDEVAAGDGVLYYSRLVAKASKSRLSRVTGLPIYQQMTIRNWNTTTRLLALMAQDAPARASSGARRKARRPHSGAP